MNTITAHKQFFTQPQIFVRNHLSQKQPSKGIPGPWLAWAIVLQKYIAAILKVCSGSSI
jgi:hypothetical protein